MSRWLLALVSLAACRHRPPEEAAPIPPLEQQKALAAVEGPDQTLEVVRLASMALAQGDLDLAEGALRQAVGRMQDFRADGEFRALIGAERSKEWKGDPYEKMMAFLYLGLLLLEEGDTGNALAMSKSAILADTGTSLFRYRADFVPAFVLQALVYERLGEQGNAERAIQAAIDAIYVRVATEHLADRLAEVDLPEDVDVRGEAAARVLLLSALPSGLAARPRDLHEAIDATLSRATDLRMLVLDGKKADRPEDLVTLGRGETRKSLEAFEPLVRGWHAAVDAHPDDVSARLAEQAAALEALVADPPSLLLWIEEGRGPAKVADGRYGEILRIVPRGDADDAPVVVVGDQRPAPLYLDSVTWQASTRGSRRVDGFLEGKAVFKDAAPALGWVLLASGDVANALRSPEDDGVVATVLYVAGVVTWVAGALTNPAADTRAWLELPDTLWLVAADPPPGTHVLRVDGREYEVTVPADGTLVHLIPAAPPHGARSIGGEP